MIILGLLRRLKRKDLVLFFEAKLLFNFVKLKLEHLLNLGGI